jgi:hypothetical protein
MTLECQVLAWERQTCGGVKHVNVIQSSSFDNWISNDIYAHIHPLNTNNTMTYNVRNPGPGFGQAHTCGRVTLVNVIPTGYCLVQPMDNRGGYVV